jgi:hypothetical protein
MANGRLVPAAPAAAVNNAAIKSTAATAKPTAAVVKPIPVAAPAKAAIPVKKPTTTTTTPH